MKRSLERKGYGSDPENVFNQARLAGSAGDGHRGPGFKREETPGTRVAAVPGRDCQLLFLRTGFSETL